MIGLVEVDPSFQPETCRGQSNAVRVAIQDEAAHFLIVFHSPPRIFIFKRLGQHESRPDRLEAAFLRWAGKEPFPGLPSRGLVLCPRIPAGSNAFEIISKLPGQPGSKTEVGKSR